MQLYTGATKSRKQSSAGLTWYFHREGNIINGTRF